LDNEGLLVQIKVAGALGIMTGEEIDTLVDAFRRVLARVR
jgi:hypothetical protein